MLIPTILYTEASSEIKLEVEKELKIPDPDMAVGFNEEEKTADDN